MKEIYSISELNLKIYINERGTIYWSETHGHPQKIEKMPDKLQVLFFIKFIQNYELASRVTGIHHIACFEMFIKGKFINNEPLNLVNKTSQTIAR